MPERWVAWWIASNGERTGWPFGPRKPIGEDDRVLRLLLQRNDRTEDQGVALALVPGDEVRDARDVRG